MSTTFRTPSAREDNPHWAVLAGIAIVCAGAGLGLACWGTYHRPPGDDEAALAAAADELASGDEGEPVMDFGAEPIEDEGEDEAPVAANDVPSPTAPAPDDTAPNHRASSDSPALDAPEADAPAPSAQLAALAPAATEAPPSAPPSADAPPSEPASATPAPRAGRAAQLTPGRVAYLRCEGVPQRRGPVPCPRDEALEAAAWRVIDTARTCGALEGARGEADIILDFPSRTAAPELRTRDTFASSVTRLPADDVLRCVGDDLRALRQSMGSSRLVVSFRFGLAPR